MLQIVAYFVAYWRTLSSGKWQWLQLQVNGGGGMLGEGLGVGGIA